MQRTIPVRQPPYSRLGYGDPIPSFSSRGRMHMLVTDELRKCVVFFGIMDRGKFLPRATGFAVSCIEHGYRYLHLVTAEHVVSGLLSKGHEIWVRMNGKEALFNEGPIPPDLWAYHPDSERKPTDVAIIPFQPPDDLDIKAVEIYGSFDDSNAAGTADVLKSQHIGPGEEVAVIGLFRSHHGVEKAIPVVRVGHLSVMREEPVHTSYCGYTDAYLVEVMSIGGLSGSPVFVSLPAIRIINHKAQYHTGKQFYLLGLMHGHFDIKNLNEDAVTDSETEALGSINAGLGVVIPVEKIIETITQPELSEMRRKIAERTRQQGATPDLSDDPSPPANGENPKHREDFMRLVGAAARKPVPKD